MCLNLESRSLVERRRSRGWLEVDFLREFRPEKMAWLVTPRLPETSGGVFPEKKGWGRRVSKPSHDNEAFLWRYHGEIECWRLQAPFRQHKNYRTLHDDYLVPFARETNLAQFLPISRPLHECNGDWSWFIGFLFM